MITANLLDDKVRIVVPFVKVTIGDYTFGIYQRSSGTARNSSGVYEYVNEQYPNYIRSLEIQKINGQVNVYTLNLCYPIAYGDDPNYFEKVFSSVSKSRKIVFSYGDLGTTEAFIYRDEEALITEVQSNFDISSSTITYVVTAVSASVILGVGAFNFPAYKSAKPSDIIKSLLKNNAKYGLQNIFTGMKNYDLVISEGLIASNDRAVEIEAQWQKSILEYISYLVSCMQSSENAAGVYTFKVIDDINNIFGGTYFRIYETDSSSNSLDTYELDIGFDELTNNAITSFTLDDNMQYTIFYDYYKENEQEETIERINDNGVSYYINSPLIASNNNESRMRVNEENWWKNVTEYPISITLTIRGLLRPAILMSKLKLNVIFYGKKHISSGEYVITKEVDRIGEDGYFTTLSAVRVAGDDYNSI